MTKKTNASNGVVKDRKPKRMPILYKIISGMLLLAITFGMGATLTACTNTPTLAEVKTVSELVEQHYEDTKDFLDEQVLEDVVKFSTGNYEDAKLLDATYDLGNGEQKSLDSVKVIFTYKDGEDRLYNINEMKFETSVDLNKIADYNANKTELAQIADDATISTQYTTTYNAVESVQNDALAEAIFKNIIKSNENIVHLTLKFTGSEALALGDSTRRTMCNKYELIAQTDKTVKSYEVAIKQQDTMQQMIDSLTNSNNYLLRNTTNIENVETDVEFKKYEKEEDIEVPPVIETIDNIGELLQNYSAETYSFLDKQTDKIVTSIVGQYNESNLKSLKYDIGADSNTKLNSVYVELVYSDPATEGKETYYRATVDFESPIDLNKIADGTATATIANSSKEVTFNYNAKEMYFRQGLVDALVAKTGYNVTEDTHVMVRFGEDVNGTTTYNMVISSNAGYNEYEFEVPTGVNEAETIKNIENFDVITSETGGMTANGYTQTAYEEQEYTIENIEEALNFYSEQINANLQPVYDYVYNNFLGSNADVLSYKIDLGEVVDGKVQNLKFAYTYKDTRANNDVYMVYNVKLPTALTVNDLLNKSTIENLTLSRQNVSKEYDFTYNPILQGDKDDFIKAVGKKLAEADFDVENSTLLYKETGGMTTRGFQIVLINEQGVREFNVNVPDTVSDDELVNAVEDLIEGTSKSVDFSNNQINVELVSESELSNYDEYGL